MIKWLLTALAIGIVATVSAFAPAAAQEQRGSSFFCIAEDSNGNVYYHSPTYKADPATTSEAYEQSFRDYMKARGLPTKGGCRFTDLPHNVPIYLDGLKQQCDDCSVWTLQRVDWAYKPAQPEESREPKDNLARDACEGFTRDNYRDEALKKDGDVQLRTMCGQAWEYYTMYRRALDQGYSVTDANRTYAAHAKSALVLNDFHGKSRAKPGEGIVPDTRTAADDAADVRAAAASESSPPDPPRAPPCDGCVRPM